VRKWIAEKVDKRAA